MNLVLKVLYSKLNSLIYLFLAAVSHTHDISKSSLDKATTTHAVIGDINDPFTNIISS